MSRSLEEEIKIKAEQVRGTARYMASFDDLIEEQIRKAREKGAFDNLEGHGKPLNLYENPYEPPEMRMVFKILKDNGMAPPWVEIGKEVDAMIEKLWQDVDKFQTYVRVIGEGASPRTIQRLEKRAENFLNDSRKRLININKKIDDFNCNCPLWWLSRGRLNVEEEMAKVVERVNESMEALRKNR